MHVYLRLCLYVINLNALCRLKPDTHRPIIPAATVFSMSEHKSNLVPFNMLHETGP